LKNGIISQKKYKLLKIKNKMMKTESFKEFIKKDFNLKKWIL